MLNVSIKTVPHKEQRYNTVGDWFYTGAMALNIRVSEMSDWRYEICVAIHELVEAFLCKYCGITQQTIDDFDQFHINALEPGDLSDCPYHWQHNLASGVERIVATCLGVKWLQFTIECEDLCK